MRTERAIYNMIHRVCLLPFNPRFKQHSLKMHIVPAEIQTKSYVKSRHFRPQLGNCFSGKNLLGFYSAPSAGQGYYTY